MERGYKVIIHGPDKESCEATVNELENQFPEGFVDYIVADFTDVDAIKHMSDELHGKYDRLDILINNAGRVELNRVMVKGIEKTFMVNYLSHFYLTLLLLDLIQSPGRIIIVASNIHAANIDFDNLQGEKSYDGKQAYKLSKLAFIYFMQELAERLKIKKITVNCVHPGIINTVLANTAWRVKGSHPSKGAKPVVYLATSDEVSEETGQYYKKDKKSSPKMITTDKENQRKLWNISEELLGIDAQKYFEIN